MNNLTKIAAIMAVVVAVFGCVVIASNDSDAAKTIYVGGTGTGGDGTQDSHFTTLAEAVQSAEAGDIITLVGDVTTDNLTITKGITLNLGGYTLEITQGTGITSGIGLDFTSGPSSIINGDIVDDRSENSTTCGYIGVRATGSGTSLTVTDVDFTQCIPNSESNYNYGFRVDAQASIVLGDGVTVFEKKQTITSKTYGNVGVAVLGNGSGQTTVEIDGAEIHTTGFGIAGNGADSDGTVITIKSGSVLSDESTGIYHPQDGTLTITGGSIIGQTGIEIRSGTLDMTGGTVTGNGNPFESDPNGSGSTTTGAGIAVVQHTTKKPIDLAVSGGTVQGYNAVYEKNLQGNESTDLEKIEIKLTGGVFEAINGGTEAVDVDLHRHHRRRLRRHLQGGCGRFPAGRWSGDRRIRSGRRRGWVLVRDLL